MGCQSLGAVFHFWISSFWNRGHCKFWGWKLPMLISGLGWNKEFSGIFSLWTSRNRPKFESKEGVKSGWGFADNASKICVGKAKSSKQSMLMLLKKIDVIVIPQIRPSASLDTNTYPCYTKKFRADIWPTAHTWPDILHVRPNNYIHGQKPYCKHKARKPLETLNIRSETLSTRPETWFRSNIF